jgi:hypothetical protein
VKQTTSYKAKNPIHRAEHPGSEDRKSLSQDVSNAEGTDTSNRVKRRRRKRKTKNMKAKREQASYSTVETALDEGSPMVYRAGKKATSTDKVERRRLKQWQKRKKKRKTDPFVKCLGEMVFFSCGHRQLELCLSCQKSWDRESPASVLCWNSIKAEGSSFGTNGTANPVSHARFVLCMS